MTTVSKRSPHPPNLPLQETGQRPKIGKPATDTTWLEGDDIVGLAHADNPDAPGTSPSWLSGPGPLNFFYVHFQRTLADDAEKGRVHIMVVNTECQHNIHASIFGSHWFTVAWLVEP